jgi:hypothetical protein
VLRGQQRVWQSPWNVVMGISDQCGQAIRAIVTVLAFREAQNSLSEMLRVKGKVVEPDVKLSKPGRHATSLPSLVM